MSIRPGLLVFWLSLGATLAGCSLLCKTTDLTQPCDASGSCLAGFSCVQGSCVRADDAGGGGPQVCDSDDECLAGSCFDGGCVDQILAWDVAGAAPQLGCYGSFPGPVFDAGHTPDAGASDAGPDGGGVAPDAGTSPPDGGTDDAGGPPPDAGGASGQSFGLGGCVAILPTDTLTGTPSVAIGGAGAEINATPSCESGYAYDFGATSAGVPVDQLFALDVSSDAGSPLVENFPLYVATAVPTEKRDVYAISPTLASTFLGALDAGTTSLDGGATLVFGLVRDCGTTPSTGRLLSGVQVAVAGGGAQVAYLNLRGLPEPGRTATGAAGMFAAYVPKSAAPTGALSLTLSGTPAGGAAPWSVVVDLQGPGILFVPVSPAGP